MIDYVTSQARIEGVQDPKGNVNKQNSRTCAQSHHSTATYDQREISNMI